MNPSFLMEDFPSDITNEAKVNAVQTILADHGQMGNLQKAISKKYF
jgi:hypothetical protein